MIPIKKSKKNNIHNKHISIHILISIAFSQFYKQIH